MNTHTSSFLNTIAKYTYMYKSYIYTSAHTKVGITSIYIHMYTYTYEKKKTPYTQ